MSNIDFDTITIDYTPARLDIVVDQDEPASRSISRPRISMQFQRAKTIDDTKTDKRPSGKRPNRWQERKERVLGESDDVTNWVHDDQSSVFERDLTSAYRMYNFPPKGRPTGKWNDPYTYEAPFDKLYLFNVIVALEWVPSKKYRAQLARAFWKASNVLYDVMDGYMAFGQVLIGGPELLQCADIQILATNRRRPRAWLNGLFDEEEHRPIRLGRGIWHQHYKLTIPWDEPEGYRTIVHEWAHYALGFRDSYLEYKPNETNANFRVPRSRPDSQSLMTIPTIWSEKENEQLDQSRTPEDEFKATFDVLKGKKRVNGPSDLLFPLPRIQYIDSNLQGQQAVRESTPLEQKLELSFDSFVTIQPDHTWVYILQIDEYGRPAKLLPQGTLQRRSPEEEAPFDRNYWYPQLQPVFPLYSQEMPTLDDQDIINAFRNAGWDERYVDKIERQLEENKGKRIRDALDKTIGKPLYYALDAHPGDVLILITNRPRSFQLFDTDDADAQTVMVYSGMLRDKTVADLETMDTEDIEPLVSTLPENLVASLVAATPPAPIPVLSLIPTVTNPDRGKNEPAEITLTLTPHGSGTTPDKCWFVPLVQTDDKQVLPIDCKTAGVNDDGEQARDLDCTIPGTYLDGHIVAQWNDPYCWMIYPVSQGGDPAAHNGAGGPPPLTAGSADGNVMIFLRSIEPKDKDDEGHDLKDLRIVTTRSMVSQNTAQLTEKIKSVDYELDAYVYSVATTEPLRDEAIPTLVLYYTKSDFTHAGKWEYQPTLLRLTKDNEWEDISICRVDCLCRPTDAPYVALSLNGQTAPDLFDDTPGVESYRLGWRQIKIDVEC